MQSCCLQSHSRILTSQIQALKQSCSVQIASALFRLQMQIYLYCLQARTGKLHLHLSIYRRDAPTMVWRLQLWVQKPSQSSKLYRARVAGRHSISMSPLVRGSHALCWFIALKLANAHRSHDSLVPLYVLNCMINVVGNSFEGHLLLTVVVDAIAASTRLSSGHLGQRSAVLWCTAVDL